MGFFFLSVPSYHIYWTGLVNGAPCETCLQVNPCIPASYSVPSQYGWYGSTLTRSKEIHLKSVHTKFWTTDPSRIHREPINNTFIHTYNIPFIIIYALDSMRMYFLGSTTLVFGRKNTYITLYHVLFYQRHENITAIMIDIDFIDRENGKNILELWQYNHVSSCQIKSQPASSSWKIWSTACRRVEAMSKQVNSDPNSM